MDCIFCKIINKEIPAEAIYEDENTLALLDIHPIAPGHCFVIPKFHIENILQVPDEKMADIFNVVKKVTQIIQDTIKPTGFTIGINHGKVSGQAIDHLHIHIIPRWLGDGGKSVHSVVNNPPKESVEEIRRKILRG